MPSTEPKTHDPKPTSSSQQGRLTWVSLALVVVIILVGTVMVLKDRNEKSKQTTTPITTAAVTVNSTGFQPATIKVAPGTTVTWKNTDSSPHRVATDPYPTNDGLPGFDSLQALQPNDSFSYTFRNPGVFTYHDQLNPYTMKATVVVQSPN